MRREGPATYDVVNATTRGTFHLSRTAETLPHIVNDIAQAFFDDVVLVGHPARGELQ